MVCKAQIRKLPHLRKFRKSKENFIQQICGFAICGTYLRTAHLCLKCGLYFDLSLEWCRHGLADVWQGGGLAEEAAPKILRNNGEPVLSLLKLNKKQNISQMSHHHFLQSRVMDFDF